MNLHLPAQAQRRPAPRPLSEEAAFRERLLAIRHHRQRVRISWLARYTAWALGLLVLGMVVVTGLMGLLQGA
jgi:hypothetical protein